MPCKFQFSKGKIKSFPGKVYVDTSVLIAAYWDNHKFYKNAKNLLVALLLAESKIYLSPLCFTEAWWAIIKKTYREKIVDKHKSEDRCEVYLKKDRKFFRQYQKSLREFKEKYIDKWVKAGLFEFVDVPCSAIQDAYNNIKETPMIPADALHYAIALGHGIDAIATGDDDFDYIPDANFIILSIKPKK